MNALTGEGVGSLLPAHSMLDAIILRGMGPLESALLESALLGSALLQAATGLFLLSVQLLYLQSCRRPVWAGKSMQWVVGACIGRENLQRMGHMP